MHLFCYLILLVWSCFVYFSYVADSPSTIYALEIYSYLLLIVLILAFVILPRFYYSKYGDEFDFDSSSVTDMADIYTGSMIGSFRGSFSVAKSDVEMTEQKDMKGNFNFYYFYLFR